MSTSRSTSAFMAGARAFASSSRLPAPVPGHGITRPSYSQPIGSGSGSGSSESGYLEFPPLKPLARPHGIHVATLHLAAYYPNNLDLYSKFAVHAAHALGIPTSNPAPLPRRKELYTVIKGPFVHKKTQENFERRHLGRKIEVYDADRSSIDLWLRYLKKHALAGVGMRAKVHEWVQVGFGKNEIVDLEAQFQGIGGGEQAEIEQAANELIEKLSREDFVQPPSWAQVEEEGVQADSVKPGEETVEVADSVKSGEESMEVGSEATETSTADASTAPIVQSESESATAESLPSSGSASTAQATSTEGSEPVAGASQRKLFGGDEDESKDK
ncbi:ribosomal protein S10 domain-containing protein [Naematelia encephala]|uniref:Small ribosomal subunit protein uS10m n=1 Tax=Naematelia encephala TaxID=71784 RepID=A0A1Y2AK90_9TREE|nr:ribosomal protein S10 domain-containing protein [Naematelia encephala]